MAKKPVGRPTLMTPETLAKLEDAFSCGATDLEACFFANISKTAFYNYQQDHPDFVERKEALRGSLKFIAKKNIRNSLLSGDEANSKWYLERKAKDEFAPTIKNEHTGAGGERLFTGIEVVHVKPEAGATGKDS